MTASKVPLTTSKQTLRREVDRLFDDFGGDFWRRPFGTIANLAHLVPPLAPAAVHSA